jgi:hypothetical protein
MTNKGKALSQMPQDYLGEGNMGEEEGYIDG